MVAVGRDKMPVSFVLEKELLAKIRESAKVNRRTLSGEVTVLIEAALLERSRSSNGL